MVLRVDILFKKLIFYNKGLDVDKTSVVDLLSQVVDFFSLVHLVVLVQGLVYEIQAIVESNWLQFRDLTKDLSPLVLDNLLVVIEDGHFAFVKFNRPVRVGEEVVIDHKSFDQAS